MVINSEKKSADFWGHAHRPALGAFLRDTGGNPTMPRSRHNTVHENYPAGKELMSGFCPYPQNKPLTVFLQLHLFSWHFFSETGHLVKLGFELWHLAYVLLSLCSLNFLKPIMLSDLFLEGVVQELETNSIPQEIYIIIWRHVQ